MAFTNKTLCALAAFTFCASTLTAQTKKILVLDADAARVAELQAVTPKATIVPVTKDTVMGEIADADGFIGDIQANEVRAAKKLRWVQTISAGVEHSLFLNDGDDLQKSNIVLTNNKIVQGPEIADHAMALLLTLSRRLYTFMDDKRAGMPQTRQAYHGIELNGKTAVIIGVGGIGTQIAIRASAFGMTVIGVDPEDKPFLPFIKRMVKPEQLDTVVPLADVVFISAPHTPKSYKMMGKREFELMKQNSYFIAVSRGAIYDMDGLVKALDSRKLAGAGVDVTDPEPLPRTHPLWKLDNAIITPHIAGRSDHDTERMIGTVKENIRRFVDGEPLVNVVDKQKGY